MAENDATTSNYSSGRAVFINVAAQLVGRVASLLAGLVAMAIVARSFGTETLGQFSFVLTIVAGLCVIVDFGLTPALADGLAKQPQARNRVWGTFLMIRVPASVAMGVLAMWLAPALRPDLAWPIRIAAIALPFLASRFFEAVYQVGSRPLYSTTASAGYAVMHVVLILAAVRFAPSLTGLVLAHVLSGVCYVAIAAPLSLRCLRPNLRIDPGTARSLLRIAAPVSVGSLFVMINTRADVVMLAYLDSDAAVGLYTASFRVFDVAALSAAILTGPLVPMFSDRARQGAGAVLEPYRHIHEVLGTVLIPLALLTPVLSESVLTLAFGEEFRDSAPVLNVLAWVAVLTFYAQVGSAANLALHEVKHGYWNAALAASLNIGLNMFLIPTYGILGAAWATLACEISLVTVSQAYLRKNIGNVFRFRHWSGIAAASGALALVVYGVLPTAHPIWRLLAGGATYLAVAVQLGLMSRAELERLRPLLRGRPAGPLQR